MILSLLGLIPGVLGTVNGITKAISDQKIVAIKAKTEEERISADERVKTLEARRDALVAAQSRSKFPIIVQSCLGLIGVIVLGKLGVWDKVVGSFLGCSGRNGKLPGCEIFFTDPLGTDLSLLVGAVTTFYLVTTMRPK